VSPLAIVDERFLNRPAELVLAVATVVALVLVAAALVALLRSSGSGSDSSRATRERVTPALAILTGSAAITFAAYLAYKLRCQGKACEFGAGDGLLGFHHWWRAHDSWQWAGQLLVAALALASSAAALWLVSRGRRGRPPLWVGRILCGAWALLVFLPVLYEVTIG
jgi:hypothetical protein